MPVAPDPIRAFAAAALAGLVILVPPAATGAAPAATPTAAGALRAHVAFLADDLLEGRATATRGYALAARYVAAQFEALGLEPAGGGGSFQQPVPLLRGVASEHDAGLAIERSGRTRALRPGEDFTLGPDWLEPRVELAAPLAFAGWGVIAPELGHDDYAELDVSGKIVVVLSGAPAAFPADLRAYHSRRRAKEHAARTRGAVGLLTVRTPDDERRTTWPRHLRQSRLPAYRWLLPDGTPHGVVPELKVTGTLSRAGAAAVFEGGPEPLGRVFERVAAGDVRGFDLGARARTRSRTALARTACANVAGLLRGSDPARAGEIVVVSGHLDHLGISTPVDGDSINNGAMDNATGIAALIEIARALAAAPRAPRRSVLFLAVTGEEKGMLGSEAFAQAPTVAGEIVANVNLDMFLALGPFRRVIAYGAEHSTLAEPVARAARAAGVEVIADPHPEEVIFVRSDQFSFVERGVPAVFPVNGEESTGWLRSVYHTPADEADQPGFDVVALEGFARFNRLLIEDVANAPAPPAWRPGDFFGERYGSRR